MKAFYKGRDILSCIPDLHHFLALQIQDRVKENHRLINMHIDEPLHDTNLRRGNGTTSPSTTGAQLS